MLVDSFETARARAIVPVATLLLAVLLFAGACSDETRKPDERSSPAREKTEFTEETTSASTTRAETTGKSPPPEISLGNDPDGKPDVVIRLEGDPGTTFSGLCSVGEERSVLSGRVPKRFAYQLKGRQISCRIEKRDGDTGDLEVILVAGDSTRSVQQTNAPGGVIEVSYEGE
ncbi:MAG TPA: hypothetical protein VEP28_05205, partial [Rubrobacter sp.]|nr:hypothetical protein [Rubrobacter sp.]